MGLVLLPDDGSLLPRLGRRRKASGFNRGVKFPPTQSKQIQAKPNKSKQNCLDLLGFIRPNRDFSMGYARKNKKDLARYPKLCSSRLKPLFATLLSPPPSPLAPAPAAARARGLQIPTLRNTLAHHSVFRQAFSYTPPSSAIAKCEPVIVRSECARQSLDRIPACGACRRRRRGSSRPPGRRRSRSNRSHWRGRHRRYSA